jgi:hypothetical protein
MPVNLSYSEAEIQRIVVQSSLGKKLVRSHLKNKIGHGGIGLSFQLQGEQK